MPRFKSKNYKILRRKYKNIRATLHDFDFCKCCLVLTPKPQTIKEIIDKLDYIKIKTFVLQKIWS